MALTWIERVDDETHAGGVVHAHRVLGEHRARHTLGAALEDHLTLEAEAPRRNNVGGTKEAQGDKEAMTCHTSPS